MEPYTPTTTKGTTRSIYTFIHSFLVPNGRITSDYVRFQAFDTLQGCSSYLRGILATSSVLRVSKDPETVVAYRWAFNHGVGMLVAMMLNQWVGWMGSEIKQARLAADVLNDVALTIEISLPYVRDEYVTYLMLLATTMKCMCGFIAGATRAAVTAHFAVDNNEADVAAKEGNQENLVTVMGLVLGGIFVKRFSREGEIISMFIVLTVLHVYWNFKAVRALRLQTLSFQRFQIAVELYIEGERPTVRAVNERERILFVNQLKMDGKVEDYVGTSVPGDGYFICLDERRIFFRRGEMRAKGFFHFIMLTASGGQFEEKSWREFKNSIKDEGWNIEDMGEEQGGYLERKKKATARTRSRSRRKKKI
mmetsp:Transcript_12632/g.25760  ORF Transcript_12632/g.25760 Transcript_12632/m.25760 type:complete len:364 (-) Transcript_12632:302-1393(-)